MLDPYDHWCRVTRPGEPGPAAEQPQEKGKPLAQVRAEFTAKLAGEVERLRNLVNQLYCGVLANVDMDAVSPSLGEAMNEAACLAAPAGQQQETP